jgi:hypothetical protein
MNPETSVSTRGEELGGLVHESVPTKTSMTRGRHAVSKIGEATGVHMPSVYSWTSCHIALPQGNGGTTEGCGSRARKVSERRAVMEELRAPSAPADKIDLDLRASDHGERLWEDGGIVFKCTELIDC